MDQLHALLSEQSDEITKIRGNCQTCMCTI